MCLLVIVGKYSCRHKRTPDHAIPDEFIRACSARSRRRCNQLIPNEEDVPWLCPDCHWDYVEKNLMPLWQQITITKCRMMQDIQIFPAEPAYISSQHEADFLESAFGMQQNDLTTCATSFHELRDSTLQGFMAENFRPSLKNARNDHRPWSLSCLREPFARTKADPDLEPTSPPPPAYIERRALAPPLLERNQRVVHASRSNVVTSQVGDVHSETVPPSLILALGSTGDRSAMEDEALGCRWCNNHGSAAGVTVDQRVCTTCRLEQSENITLSPDRLNMTPSDLRNPVLVVPRDIPAENYGALDSVSAGALRPGLHQHVLPREESVIPHRHVDLSGAAHERATRHGGVAANRDVQYECSRFGSTQEAEVNDGQAHAYNHHSEASSQERAQQRRHRQGASEGGGRSGRRREGRREEGRR
jgi:hypothetical protein